MKKTKSFKAGTSIETVGHFAKTAVDELTGDTGSHTTPKSVRIVVEVLGNEGLVIGPVLGTFEIEDAREAVERFLEYRRDELAKPVKSISALRRLLKPWKGRAGLLVESIEQSIRHGWTGLFEPKGGGSKKADRSFRGEGGSRGGEF